MKAFLLICLLGLAASFQLADIDAEFSEFMTTYGKVYTPEELVRRKQIFLENKRRVLQLQLQSDLQGGGAKYGVTKFFDLTPEEFKANYMGYRPHKSTTGRKVQIFKETVTDIPTSFDWRTKPNIVTPVKDQAQCGSCWAFSATEGVESAWALAKGTQVVLSPQQVVSCDTVDEGCNGGDLPSAFDYLKKYGQEDDKDYPYTSGGGNTGRCKYNAKDVVAHISGFGYATKNKNETAMQAAMLVHGPLSICVDAETWQYYTGGIIKSGCARDLDHCVQLVGWDTSSNTPYWIVRNSWGTDWGLSGYLWVERNKDLCGIADEATYVLI